MNLTTDLTPGYIRKKSERNLIPENSPNLVGVEV